MGLLTRGMVVTILAQEDSSARFERFCVELFSKLDGTEYVTTSASWDLGRDGRQATLFSVDVFPIVCVSLNDKVPNKAKKDLQRLLSTTQLAGLRFCSSQALSEHTRDAIKAELRAIAPRVETVEVEGSEQIDTITRRHKSYSDLFERFYPGEIAEHCAYLASREVDDERKVTGMRIALSTQLSDDGAALRRDLLHNLTLTALSDGRKRSQAGIAKLLSDSLHLGRIVHEGYVISALSELEAKHYVKRDGNVFVITEEGKEAAACRAGSGAEMLSEGQSLLREAIELLSGRSLSESNYLEVWRIVKEEISEMLYLNGMQTIGALASLTEEGQAGLVGQVDLMERIDCIGGKIDAQLGKTPISKDIGQAVVDAFRDTTTAVFDWFTKLCTCYTAICALGLSEESQRALVSRLRRLNLFLDTDIALSLLAEGEPDHDKLGTLIEGWKKVGGTLYVAVPVLEELAYHASISELDFREVYHQLHTYSEPEARRLITNAFVRGYWAAGRRLRGRYSQKDWRQYIANFRGKDETDYSRIADELRSINVQPFLEEHGEAKLAKKVAAKISEKRTKASPYSRVKYTSHMIDKSNRDGRLVADVFAFRRESEATKATAVIVSSSPLLAKVCREKELFLGNDPLVLSVAALAYLLSLVPGAHISLYGLRKLLFDTRFHEHVTVLERRALRVLHSSNEYSLPFSLRGRLDEAMMDRIKKVADERGTKPHAVFEELESRSEESTRLWAEIVRDSVDAIAKSESEKEIDRLQVENARLREALARAERK